MNNKYTREIIEEALIDSKTWSDVCRKLNIKPSSGSQTYLVKRAKALGIETPSYFLGQRSNLGRSFEKKDAIEYCKKGLATSSHRLKLRLIRDGYKEEKCENCGLSEWMNEPIVLELDHKDSDHDNNELSNLQILCANCHALKTRKNRKSSCNQIKDVTYLKDKNV